MAHMLELCYLLEMGFKNTQVWVFKSSIVGLTTNCQ
jgi:hypothetical protein